MKYSDLYALHRPLAVAAHRAIQEAIRSGLIAPADRAGNCADCGREGECYDHRDYTKPLVVDVVCRSCNRRRGPGIPYIGLPTLTGGPARPARKLLEQLEAE